MATKDTDKKTSKSKKTTKTSSGTSKKPNTANKSASSSSSASTAKVVVDTVKKMNKKQQKTLLIVVLVLVAICAVYLLMGDPLGILAAYHQSQEPQVDLSAPSEQSSSPLPAANVSGVLDVYVLDVGQGDAIFLKSPSGKTMLVDTSTSSGWTNLSTFLNDNNIKKLDVVIATHPHEDHIGSMNKVIANYEIGTFYMPDATTNTRTFERMLDALDEHDVNVVQAKAGEMISWDDQVEIRILNPVEGKEYKSLNDYSVMCRVKFGNTSIMLTGDAETEAEEDAMHESPAEYFSATVLKAGHHGSRTSSSEAFLKAVNPSLAVVSCGVDNSYGHPHNETVQTFDRLGIPWYRTDTQGTVHLTLDGSKVDVRTER